MRQKNVTHISIAAARIAPPSRVSKAKNEKKKEQIVNKTTPATCVFQLLSLIFNWNN
jgi:hypothetical protein